MATNAASLLIIMSVMLLCIVVVLSLKPMKQDNPARSSVVKLLEREPEQEDIDELHTKPTQEKEETDEVIEEIRHSRNDHLPSLPNDRVGNEYNRNRQDYQYSSAHGDDADMVGKHNIRVSAFDPKHKTSGYGADYIGVRRETLKYFENVTHICINNRLYTIRRIDPHSSDTHAYIYITEKIEDHEHISVGTKIKLDIC